MMSESVLLSLETLKELAKDWRQTPTSTIAGVIRFEYATLRTPYVCVFFFYY